MLSVIALTAAKNSRLPIAIILDHGKNMDNILKCIELGISVMVDGSHLPFEENIALTKRVVEIAHAAGVSVEGELGSIGGTEDTDEEIMGNMTDPVFAKEFVDRTGIDALDVAVGNIHGKYIKPPVLDFDRLQRIKNLVNVPLVLHGGSDLPLDISIRAINIGIKKFNIGTDLKYAMSESLRSILNMHPMPFQPQHTFGIAREAVKNVAIGKIHIFKNNQELENLK
jgi:fructose-bisphosphate aldolase class II